MQAFKAGVDADPENKAYRYNYGVLLLNAEKYEEEGKVLEAVKCYEEYNQLNNNLEKKEKISL